MNQRHLRSEQRERFNPEGELGLNQIEDGGRIATEQGGQQLALDRLVGKAKHVLHLGGSNPPFPAEIGMGNGLVED